MAEEGEVSAVVCDNGSGVVKVCSLRGYLQRVAFKY
jgi:hypothetical protein